MEVPTNGYVITHSALSSNKVEEICQTMTGKGAKKGAKMPSGKALLSCLRALCMSHIIFHNSFDVGVSSVLLEILRSQADSDIERKAFRTSAFLLLELIYQGKQQKVKEDQTHNVKEYFDAMKREALKGVGIKRAFGLRSLGVLFYESALMQKISRGSSAANKTGLQGSSSVNQEEIFNILINNLVALRVGAAENKEQWADRILQLNAVFCALRRFNKPLTRDSIAIAFSTLKLGEGSDPHGMKCLMRNAAMVLQANAHGASSSEDVTWWTSALLELFQSGSKILCFKDELATSMLLHVSSLLVSRNCSAVGKVYTAQSIDLVVEICKLLAGASIKFVGDFIRFFLSPELGWNLLPTLEGRKVGVISIVSNSLTAFVSRLSIEDVKACVIFRACESFGRFLLMRPHFSSSEYNHRLFAIDIVGKDGECAIQLWIALRKLYRMMHEPKAEAANYPPLILSIASKQGSGTLPKDAKNYWAFPMDQFASASCSVPNPYIYAMLLRCLIWLAPDERYWRKEHLMLWSNLFTSLCDSFELLGLMMDTATLTRVSVSSYMVELLQHCFARIKASTFMREDDTSESFGVHQNKIGFRFQFVPKYLEVLVGLTQLTLKYILPHPSLSSLLPNIWAFIHAVIESSSNPDDRQLASLMLLEHLCNILAMTQVHAFAETSSIGIVEGLKLSAIWYLCRILPALEQHFSNSLADYRYLLQDLLGYIQEEYSIVQPAQSAMLIKALLVILGSILDKTGNGHSSPKINIVALFAGSRSFPSGLASGHHVEDTIKHLVVDGDVDLLVLEYSRNISRRIVVQSVGELPKEYAAGSYPLNSLVYKVRDCTQDLQDYADFPHQPDGDFSFVDSSTRRLSSSKSDMECVSIAESVEGLDPFGSAFLQPSPQAFASASSFRKQDGRLSAGRMGDAGTGAALEFDSFGWDNKDHKVDSHAAFHSWDSDAASATQPSASFDSAPWPAATDAWGSSDTSSVALSIGSIQPQIMGSPTAHSDWGRPRQSEITSDPFAATDHNWQTPAVATTSNSSFDVLTTHAVKSASSSVKSAALPAPSSTLLPPPRRGSEAKPPSRPVFLPPPSTANKRPSQSHTSPVFGEVDNLIGKEMSKVGSSAKVDVWPPSNANTSVDSSWNAPKGDPFSMTKTSFDPLETASDPFRQPTADPFASSWTSTPQQAPKPQDPFLQNYAPPSFSDTTNFPQIYSAPPLQQSITPYPSQQAFPVANTASYPTSTIFPYSDNSIAMPPPRSDTNYYSSQSAPKNPFDGLN